MIYLDYNFDRNCQWSDIPESERQTAARAMLEVGKYITVVRGQPCKLEKQERLFLEKVLGIAPIARATETGVKNPIREKVAIPKLGTSPEMRAFRDLVQQGLTRAGEIASEMPLEPYQVSRLARRAIRDGWLVKRGMDYAMRHATGRPRKL